MKESRLDLTGQKMLQSQTCNPLKDYTLCPLKIKHFPSSKMLKNKSTYRTNLLFNDLILHFAFFVASN